MTIEGVDYADARPSPAGLYAAGKRFVVRYGGPGRDSKQLHAGELQALLAAGLSVVANAEGSAGGFQGEAAGRAWAAAAEQHFRGLGMPAGRPIYFSVDVGSPDLAAVDAACRGAAAVIGAARVGVYGGYATIAHVAKAGTARWLWQTYAWSSGRWWPGAHIQQYRNGVQVAGGDCDLNRALVEDFGQWGQETDMAKQDVLDALDEFFAVGKQPAAKGGLPESKIGHDASAQGVPDTIDGGTTLLYQLIGKIGTLTKSIAAKLDVPISEVLAAVGDVDEQVLARLADAGRSDEEVAAALRAALGDRAAGVGRLLAGA